jgi:hypothetical protein
MISALAHFRIRTRLIALALISVKDNIGRFLQEIAAA